MYDESWLPRIGSNIRLLRGACQFNKQQFNSAWDYERNKVRGISSAG